MQTAQFDIAHGGHDVQLWRGIPAEITILGVEDTSGDWIFLVDNDNSDGVILSGTVAASGNTLVVTLAEMNTVELKNAIQGRKKLKFRATLTNGSSRVYTFTLYIRNRAVEGTPTPVSEYYTKSQIDAMISGQIDLDYATVTNKPQINGVTLAGNKSAEDLGLLSSAGQAIIASGVSIIPAQDDVYRHELAANDAITIDTTGLSSSVQVTFELHLVQPATAVTFTLPAGVIWANGDAFASGNAAPTMNTADTLYCLVFRWDGANLLGNLAYSKAVAA